MKYVKKLSLIFLMAVVLIGCSKDDDKSDSASLIGTWKATAEKLNGQPIILDACDLKTTVTFTTTTIKVVGFDGDNCEERYEMAGTYTRNGNTLNLSMEGETMAVEITKLTATTLIIKSNDEDGVSEQTFTRQ